MAEYIEKEAILRHLADVQFGEKTAQMWDGVEDAMQAVIHFPAADVVPVRHGRWKKSYADHEAFGVRPFFRYCSWCHEATVHPYNFCPNCGCAMDQGG